MPPSQRDLVTLTSQGDAAALEDLLAQNLPRLRAYVRVRMGDALRAKESATDLVQSVCREVLGQLDGYEFRSDVLFRKWLFEQAHRKVIDRARHYRAQRRDAAREVDDDGNVLDCYRTFCTPSRHAIGREALEEVESAFQELPEPHQQVILLARIIGMPHAQIAEEMGRSEAAVRVLLFRALKRLEHAIGSGS